MAQRVIRIDDIDGSEPASEVTFSLDGADYVIDLGARNIGKLNNALKPFIERSRLIGGVEEDEASKTATLFSQLDSRDKERFRRWSDMPKARRVADARVQEWLDLGKPPSPFDEF